MHTTFHISEDETGDRLTDVLEIHFLELDKLKRIDELKDAKDETLKWLRFLDAKSKEEMQVIAKQDIDIDIDIEKAYEMLEIMSKSKEKRMAYEARQAEIMDQRTREKIAKEQGIKQGEEKKAKEIAKPLLGILDDESISEKQDFL